MIAQAIKWRAQAPDHIDGPRVRRRAKPVSDGDRIITTNHRAEIAGRGKLMVQPPVDDHKAFAATFLNVHHARQVNAGFGDKVTP